MTEDMMKIKNCLEDQIQLLLSIMPRGTRHIGTKQEMITDLSIPYTITMEHPRFVDGTTIELDYVRDFYKKPVSGIEQFGTLLGIRYIGPDGKDVYKIESK
jgi:hypothetical protein